ncbi:MAG: GvpL/GvpF family gas vesicle protein, partial [Acidobacteriaceae bacterium]
MSWYAYCLTEQQALNVNGTRSRRPFLMEGIQGVNGAPVLSYPSGDFAVIVSEYDRAAGNGKLEEKTVLEHAHVVSVCFRSGTVLPFRFGTIFDTDEALRQAVRTNRRAFGVSVERLRGKSEMHLKVLVKDGSLRGSMPDVPLPDTVGGDYLIKLR